MRALLESIDVPWTERTQSIYVRHLPARTIGFTSGAGSRGQAGPATPVPFVYVEFFTTQQAREVIERVEEGLQVHTKSKWVIRPAPWQRTSCAGATHCTPQCSAYKCAGGDASLLETRGMPRTYRHTHITQNRTGVIYPHEGKVTLYM